MAYHVELRGVPLFSQQSNVGAYVIQGSVSLEHAIAERPIARLAVRVPDGAAFAPQDFDELTIDYPGRPYRAEAERHADLVSYWRLDEAAVTVAADTRGVTPLTYGGGNDLEYRAFRQETAAVPYGGAPEWTGRDAGLTGTLPTGLDPTWTIAGFVRLRPGATSLRDVFHIGDDSAVNSDRRRLYVTGLGAVAADIDGLHFSTARGAIQAGSWHHLAIVRTPARVGLWVDGVEIDHGPPQPPPNESPIDGEPIEMARRHFGAAEDVDLALDEWGIWATDIDVAALYARARHDRHFGGYVFGITDVTDMGPEDVHVLQLACAGYGLRLDKTFVREVYASASGSSVRAIVHDVLEAADIDADFTSHGVELEDTVIRAVYPVESVMSILRKLADDHGAIVTVDEWREIDMVRRADIEHSPLTLSSANVASIGRTTEPRFFSSRAIVVGRGERGVVEDERTGDGATVRWDASQPIGEVLSIVVDGVEEEFDSMGAPWTSDKSQQRFERTTAPNVGDSIKFTYVSAEALVVSADNAAAITAIGFPVSARYEDDAIDDVSVARVVAQARLDRHDQRFEEFVATTIPGAVKRLRAGVAPTWTFPRHGLANRLLVESVSERLGRGGADFHPVVLTIKGTALDYQGDSGDDWRQILAYRPPAPRPEVPGTADPDQTIIRPENIAVPVSLPIRLGGEAAVPVRTAAWAVPDGAILTRVSGHEIGVLLALSFMAKCLPRGTLGAGQQVEVRLWDATTSAAIGSAVVIDETTAARGSLRGIALPLREFDLTYQARVVGALRGAAVWGVALHLDIG